MTPSPHRSVPLPSATGTSRATLKRPTALFALALLLLVVSGTVSTLTLSRYRTAEERRHHSQLTVTLLAQSLTALLNVETAGRGFALTGQEEYLAPYSQGVAQFEQQRQALARLFQDQLDQQERLRRFQELARERFALAAEFIQSRRTEGVLNERVLDIAPEGKRKMDEARALVDEIVAVENARLAQNEELARARSEQSAMATLMVLAVATLLLAIALYHYLREHRSRLHAEDTLRESNRALELERDRAESADRLKSAFLATMSHELRTPLNSIIGFTGVLRQGLAGPINAEQQKQLGMVQDSARHLLKLINEVLDLSKIEAGQLSIEATPFQLEDALRHVATIVSTHAQQKGLEFTLSNRVTGEAVSDRRRLEQILINLLANAIKFTERGAVRLEVREEASDLLRFDVSDTGIGIKAEDIPRLFQPFQQVEGGLARPHDGTGLGLSISRKLALLLGGSVDVESVWGKGSVFTVRIPRHRPAPANAAAIAAPSLSAS